MNLGRALTYAFDDREWFNKLLIVAVLTFASFLLFPLAILFGYMLDIAVNVRDGQRVILPRWDDYTDRMTRGAGLMAAILSITYR